MTTLLIIYRLMPASSLGPYVRRSQVPEGSACSTRQGFTVASSLPCSLSADCDVLQFTCAQLCGFMDDFTEFLLNDPLQNRQVT